MRSIEQNELAITADRQVKAILVFTGVTVVFLPLSFFTSYWAMNLEGIRNTTRSEGYFLKVYGTLTRVVIALVSFFAFRVFRWCRLWASRRLKVEHGPRGHPTGLDNGVKVANEWEGNATVREKVFLEKEEEAIHIEKVAVSGQMSGHMI